ncbi:MAG: DUF2807 domain-containing protein [Spirochaetaceae bacterium]|jgi:hypothetical protein|nr:DUF2807 domain-containing protein [Spirochaetaceae bacterium]
MRNYFVGLVFLLAVCFNGYGFERDVSPFHAVESNGIVHVKVHFGQNYRVAAQIPDNLEQYLVFSVQNDTLFIDTRPGQYGPVEFLVDVYAPTVDSITLSGTGNVVLDSGSGARLTVINNGIGSFDGSNYQTSRATVSAGGGNIRIWAVDELDATVFGVGSVYYYGDPELKAKRSGLGKIVKG